VTARASRSGVHDGGGVPATARNGFVLVAALVALIVIALLITGAFFASGQELGVARNELRDQQAFGFAEYAVARAAESWDRPARELMTPGQTVQLAPVSNAMLDGRAFVTRLDTALYVIVAEGRIASGDGSGLRRRVGVVVRTVRGGAPINPPIRVSEHAWTALY
jgi:type II secretory pathway pseudopilin PulG